MNRVGIGYDVHRFSVGPGGVLMGGVVVDDARGVEATSDGDVVAHAVADALLGAAALGDLGTHFPSSDDRWHGADSMTILATVVGMVAEAGYSPGNVDLVIVAQDLRVDEHRDAIVRSLAGVLDIPADAVSVKATSTDGMGAIGAGEGLAALAVTSLIPH